MSKKVALVSHEMSYTGAPRSLLNLALVLRSQGAEVDVWSMKDGPFAAEFAACDMKPRIVDEAFPQQLRRYDVAVFNTIFTASLCSMAQKDVRAVLYVREAKNIADIAAGNAGMTEHLCRIEEMICVSEYAEMYIKKYHPKTVHVVHNFVKDVYRGGVNYPWDGIVHFLVSGTLEWRKAQDIAVASFLGLPEKLRHMARLHIAGGKPQWAREYWENLKLSHPGVVWHGEIQDEKEKLAFYRKMNVFVIPSWDESCSLVALEGAMLGKAVIVSQNVGAKYMMRDEKYIFETGNGCDLTRKMAMLCSRRELLRQGLQMRRGYLRTSDEKLYRKEIKKILL